MVEPLITKAFAFCERRLADWDVSFLTDLSFLLCVCVRAGGHAEPGEHEPGELEPGEHERGNEQLH